MNRQQALDQLRLMQAWHEDFGNGPNADYDAICYAIGVIEAHPAELENLIKALEKEHQRLLEMQKVQPHTYRGVTLNDVMMYFDSLEGNEDAWTEFCSCFECRGWGLYHIRSATDINVGTNDDCISRQAALDIFDDYNVAVENGQIEAYSRDRKRLCDLPPAQPETATVTIGRTKGSVTMWYECDACGEPVDQKDCYCRNCGRKLIHD